MKTETKKARYYGTVWGRKPGWGYDSSWCFGESLEAAAADLVASCRKWGPAKFALPADVFLKDDAGKSVALVAAADGSFTVKPDPAWLVEMLAAKSA